MIQHIDHAFRHVNHFAGGEQVAGAVDADKKPRGRDVVVLFEDDLVGLRHTDRGLALGFGRLDGRYILA